MASPFDASDEESLNFFTHVSSCESFGDDYCGVVGTLLNIRELLYVKQRGRMIMDGLVIGVVEGVM